MPRIKMDARSVKSLKPDENKQVDYWDETLPGFGLRISPGGKKTWIYMYRHRDTGQKRRYTIAPYSGLSLADARDEARTLLGRVTKGEDPAMEKRGQRRAGTFRELCDAYIEEHAKGKAFSEWERKGKKGPAPVPNKRSWRADFNMIKKNLLPSLATRKVHSIHQEDIEALIEAIYDRGAPIRSNRTLDVVRGMFNWALGKAKWRREFQINSNPCLGVKKLGKERQRDRVLSDEEIRAVWNAAESDGSFKTLTFQLRILTAQRGGEIHTMRWDDIDLEAGWWTIPAEYSKNELPHRVPLVPAAVDVLNGLKEGASDPEWVFPKVGGGGPIVNIQKMTARVRKASKVKDFRPHDLRRTVASQLASMGIPRLTVAKILNHVETDVTKVYDRYGYDKEKRQALESWGQRLKVMLAGGKGEGSNVVPFQDGGRAGG